MQVPARRCSYHDLAHVVNTTERVGRFHAAITTRGEGRLDVTRRHDFARTATIQAY